MTPTEDEHTGETPAFEDETESVRCLVRQERERVRIGAAGGTSFPHRPGSRGCPVCS